MVVFGRKFLISARRVNYLHGGEVSIFIFREIIKNGFFRQK
tara:strand:- start:2334 stop:2456 length:123 start_codon:yes stop_codon:yes gene_type:complete